MPSSKGRRRVEIPTYVHERLAQLADAEDRTITSVLTELLQLGLTQYQPAFIPSAYMDRFDTGARQALALAKDEARLLNHNYLGTEHVLLGLLREGEGIAAQVLRRLWIEPDKVRDDVIRIIGRGEQAPAGEIEYVPRVRKVLAFAVDEAQRLGHDHVGTEHLLLGIVREGEGIAAGILQAYGVLGKVRGQTLTMLSQRESAAPSGSSVGPVDEAVAATESGPTAEPERLGSQAH